MFINRVQVDILAIRWLGLLERSKITQCVRIEASLSRRTGSSNNKGATSWTVDSASIDLEK